MNVTGSFNLLRLGLLLLLLRLRGAHGLVWPQPKRVHHARDRPLLYVTPATAFVVESDKAGSVLRGAVERYNSLLRRQATANAPPPAQRLRQIVVGVASHDDTLSAATSYAYTVRIQSAKNATIMANTCYGAAHALESVVQLFETTTQSGGIFPVEIEDYPSFPWRGVMLDVGRRFAPVSMIENLLDTMAAVKLSVLHLHASDYCRFAIESKRYPQLGLALQPGKPDAGVYSQVEIRQLIRYAKLRGIRIVPEFDLPGHAYRWASTLQETGTGLTLCHGTDYTIHHNDSTYASYHVLHSLLEEMASLFEDEVMHVGMDEVVDPAPCSTIGTLKLEQMLVDAVENDFGKTVMGWNPIAVVVRNQKHHNVIVNSYMANAAAAFVKEGFSVVDSESSHWYFTHPAGWDQNRIECAGGCAGAKGWGTCWHPPGGSDGSDRDSDSQSGQLMGGEMSMWTDDYVKRECGAHGPTLGLANGSCFYGRDMDEGFQQSLGGMMWPRGLVAAGAFYNYNASLNASSEKFAERIHLLNNALQQRGAFVCPSGIACSYVGAGGRLYSGVNGQELDGFSCSKQKT